LAVPIGAGRRLRRGGYNTRDQARTALRRIHLRTAGSPRALTLRDWLEQWMASRGKLRASTRRNYTYLFEQHLVPKLGNTLLSELSLPRVQAAFDTMARVGHGDGPLSPSTLARARAALRTALNAAVRAGLITDNPVRLLELPAPPRPRPVVWTQARVEHWQSTGHRPPVAVWTAVQTAHFLSSIRSQPLYPAFHLAALRGLRRGEITGLRWEDLDLEEGLLSVVRQLQRHDGQYVASPPKSKASTRTIALDDDTVAVLRQHRDHTQRPEHGFVFTRPDGQPLSPERLSRLMRAFNQQAGLPPVRFHDLRHGAASLALAAGTDLKVVQDMLGHASIVLTADTYVSVLPEVAHKSAADTATLIRQAGRLIPGANRPRHPEYPRPQTPSLPQQSPAA
jgi:integrase